MSTVPAPASTEHSAQRPVGAVWGAWIGLAGIALSAAAGVGVESLLSQPWPSGADPAFWDFLQQNRSLLLAQSLLFVMSAAASVWFLGFIRARLARAEGWPAPIAGIAFGAGVLSFGMIIIGQAAQIALLMPADTPVTPEVAFVVESLCSVTTALANIPAAVMFVSVAVLALTRHAFPRWLGWIALLSALTSLFSGLTVASDEGLLAPTGWLTTVVRLVPILFYVPAALVLMSRRGPVI